jgi:transposase
MMLDFILIINYKFMDKEIFLGIDVSKGYADFIPLNTRGESVEKSFQLTDNSIGRKQLVTIIKKWLSSGAESIYCGLESTGGYENNWYYSLKGLQSQEKVFACRLNPKVVKSTGDAKLRRTITDRVSAENIALYLSKFREDVDYGLQHVTREEFKVGRDILTGTRMLIKQRTQLLNQLEKWLYDSFPEVLTYCRNGVPLWLLKLLIKYPSAKKVSSAKGGILKIKGISSKKASKLKSLAKQSNKSVNLAKEHLISTTAKEILHKYELVNSQEKYLIDLYKDHDDVKLLQSIVSVGLKSAVTFVLEIDGVDRFDDVKKIASYFGLHPTYKESGDGRWGNHMSKRGRGTMRANLYMCAKSGIRFNEPLKDIYARCRAKGMGYNQAIGAAMHKLLRIIYGVLKSKKPFDAEVDRNNQEKAKEKQKMIKENRKQKLKEKRKSLHRYQGKNLDGPMSGRKALKTKKQMASQTSDLK